MLGSHLREIPRTAVGQVGQASIVKPKDGSFVSATPRSFHCLFLYSGALTFDNFQVLKVAKLEEKLGEFLFLPLPCQRRPRGEKIFMIVYLDQKSVHAQSMKEIKFLNSATYFLYCMVFICNIT